MRPDGTTTVAGLVMLVVKCIKIMPTNILEKIKTHKTLTILWSSLLPILGALWSVGDRFLDPLLQTEMQTLLLAQLTISITLLVIFLVATLIYLYGYNSKFKDYEFHFQAGSWIHKKHKTDRACAGCQVVNRFSSLRLDNETGLFVCPKCGNESLNIPCVIPLAHVAHGAAVERQINT